MGVTINASAPSVFLPSDASLEMVGRNCTLQKYNASVEIPPIVVDQEMVAFASPDSTFFVTRKLLEDAKQSILIGIYDFTAKYVETILADKIAEGVEVTLMLDLDNRTGETELFNRLVKKSCHGVSAPSCANENRLARYFRSSHEKVIVIDDEWTIVQSGNYSEASIPENDGDGTNTSDFVPGNRDMGVAVRSRTMAALFRKILFSDIKLAEDAPQEEGVPPPAGPPMAMFEAAPRKVPPLTPSMPVDLGGQALEITPILSPDNYMDLIPSFLAAAKKSIRIEQQYIRGNQEHIAALLEAVKTARDKHEDLEIRIVLAVPIGVKSRDKEAQNLELLAQTYGLELGAHIRFLNPGLFVHCHNKLIVVDEERVLVSSQNWSDAAVAENREAGLLIPYAPFAEYFAHIFDGDWDSGVQDLVFKKVSGGDEAAPGASLVAVNPGDYDEV
jgi:phosphatidylserine/phosphatidylglycerophosphate/cardiolipin synthase-like enzyme